MDLSSHETLYTITMEERSFEEDIKVYYYSHHYFIDIWGSASCIYYWIGLRHRFKFLYHLEGVKMFKMKGDIFRLIERFSQIFVTASE
jgi:hypothetical protein